MINNAINHHCERSRKTGFTLIELSIVLVIIGLIIGGVLVGRDLIKAAEIRAQISQFEQYKIAVTTFKLKYKYLPGDIPASQASALGFTALNGSLGNGNGDEILQSQDGNWMQLPQGETGLFWKHLSQAKLISGAFNQTWFDCCIDNYPDYLPATKLGRGGLIFAVSSAWSYYAKGNVFAAYGNIEMGGGGGIGNATPPFTVNETYAMDIKMDDGLPLKGLLIAGESIWGPDWNDTSARSGSTTTCQDNSNVSGTRKYSLSQSGGNGVNCYLWLPIK